MVRAAQAGFAAATEENALLHRPPAAPEAWVLPWLRTEQSTKISQETASRNDR